MATRFVLTPESAQMPTSAYPDVRVINGRPVIAFDADAKETVYWTGIVPQGWTGTKSAIVTYMMAGATSGLVDFEMAVEAVTPGDAVDLDAATSFDTVNTQAGQTVPGTAGYEGQLTITLTNNDSSAAGDYIRFGLTRDATDATNDTATLDAYVLAVEIRDGA